MSTEARALQMLVTGFMVGSLLRQDDLIDVDVIPAFDSEDNYLPEFTIVGNQSGTRLRVTVEIEDGEST